MKIASHLPNARIGGEVCHNLEDGSLSASPLLSIIIPVYNAERFVSLTLDSILSQSFTDYEIILINDGSQDGSATICRDYAEAHKRITFIDKENEGVARTRNRAIELAKGEYVAFVDADDILFPETLGKLAETIRQQHPDLLRFDFQTIDESGSALYPNHLSRKRRHYAGRAMEAVPFMQRIIRSEYFLCMHIFRRDILNEHGIRFLAGCTFNEDTLLIIQYLQYAKSCLYTDTVAYGYRKQANAVTAHFTERNFTDVKRVCLGLLTLSDGKPQAMRKAILRVIESLALRLRDFAQAHPTQDNEYMTLIHLCLDNRLLTEWKAYHYLPSTLCRPVMRLIELSRKFQNRL